MSARHALPPPPLPPCARRFIDCRNHVGSTMRVPPAGADAGAAPVLARHRSAALPGAHAELPASGGSKPQLPHPAAGAGARHAGAKHHHSGSNGTAAAAALWTPAAAAVAAAAADGAPALVAMHQGVPAYHVVDPSQGLAAYHHAHAAAAPAVGWMWGVPPAHAVPYAVMAPTPSASLPHSLGTPASGSSPMHPPAGGVQAAGGQWHRHSASNGHLSAAASLPGSPASAAAAPPPPPPGAPQTPAPHRLAHASFTTTTWPAGAGGAGAGPADGGAAAPPQPVLLPPHVPALGAPEAAAMWGTGGVVPWPLTQMPSGGSSSSGSGLLATAAATAAATPSPPAATPAAAAAAPWSTAVFRLFMADGARGHGVPNWWFVDPNSSSGAALGPSAVVGPLGAEAMIMSYARGSLSEAHLVCGTQAEVGAALPPGLGFFEELGTLLRQVEAGGQYVLVTLAEVQQAPASARGGGGVGGGRRGAAQQAAGGRSWGGVRQPQLQQQQQQHAWPAGGAARRQGALSVSTSGNELDAAGGAGPLSASSPGAHARTAAPPPA